MSKNLTSNSTVGLLTKSVVGLLFPLSRSRLTSLNILVTLLLTFEDLVAPGVGELLSFTPLVSTTCGDTCGVSLALGEIEPLLGADILEATEDGLFSLSTFGFSTFLGETAADFFGGTTIFDATLGWGYALTNWLWLTAAKRPEFRWLMCLLLFWCEMGNIVGLGRHLPALGGGARCW